MDPNNTNPPQPPPNIPPPPTPPPMPVRDEQITEIENPPIGTQPGSPPPQRAFPKKLITVVLILVAVVIALYAIATIFLGAQLNTLLGIKPTPTLIPQPTKNPDPMANWQTYTNNDLGFTLRFPDGWKVTDESTNAEGPKQIRFTPTNAPIPSGLGTRPYGYEFIVSAEKDVALTPEAYWSEKITTGMRTPATESITVDGSLGISTSNNAVDAHDTTIYLSKNNTLYTLQENYYMSDGAQARAQFPQAEKEFEQILSTFKFIDQDNSDMSQWKTYTNTAFSFKYPQNYTETQNTKNLVAWGADNINAMELYSQTTKFPIPTVGAAIFPPSASGTITAIDAHEAINVGGKTAEKYIFNCGTDCYFYDLYFSVGDTFYLLRKNIAGGGLEAEFNQLLSTFRFTN